MEVVWNCGIPPKTPILFYSIPGRNTLIAFSTHSLLKVPNSRIIPTLTFQFESPDTMGIKPLGSIHVLLHNYSSFIGTLSTQRL